jgi:hypothetical protein
MMATTSTSSPTSSASTTPTVASVAATATMEAVTLILCALRTAGGGLRLDEAADVGVDKEAFVHLLELGICAERIMGCKNGLDGVEGVGLLSVCKHLEALCLSSRDGVHSRRVEDLGFQKCLCLL